jgi:hypothetical protein
MRQPVRLPSFNDFSPGILKKDLRPCLAIVKRHAGDNARMHREFASLFFSGVLNKRATTNIPATLRSTGLSLPKPDLELSAFGLEVLASKDSTEAARAFCAGIIKHKNGDQLLTALQALGARREPATKATLKAELQRQGVTSLSTGTTDHTTLMNWMVVAGIVDNAGGFPKVDDKVLKAILGISASESEEFNALTPAQQVFLELLRKRHEVEPGPFLVSDLLDACLKTYPYLFDEDQFAKDVRKPLVDDGWIEILALAGGKQGGKSGRVQGKKKLLDIPVEQIVPDLDASLPRDLRSKINVPLENILKDVRGKNTHKAGLALELLAVRMIWDLDLQVRHFRLRSKESAYAEVDVVAEGAHLLFSRWTIQCKRLKKGHVNLGDVAKEVGIAIYTHSHVVVMVSTTDFSKEAYNYAQQISRNTFLQFLFVPGSVVDRYLREGRAALWDHVLANARHVMQEKRAQSLSPAPLVSPAVPSVPATADQKSKPPSS